jgi:uncharacterized protein YndB with AHSA1/START domain
MSAATVQPAPVRKSVVVQTDANRAFAAFAGKIGRWWPHRHSIGTSPQADVVLEPRAGGRWYERGEDGSECDWGKVLAWEPPARLLLAWQIGGNWKYDPTLVTEVEVTFTALGPRETRVDLEHRNLERYGEESRAVRAAFESPGGWRGMLEAFAALAQAAEEPE